MISEKSLVVYKNHPAVVSGFDGEKINITVFRGDSVKVRVKDIELLHEGPCALKDLEVPASAGNAREAWELLAGEESGEISLRELAELVYGSFSPADAWAAWELLHKGLYFTGDLRGIKARNREAVEEDEKKQEEKQRETGDRGAFLEKLKKLPAFKTEAAGLPTLPPEISETDRRYLQDVESLARGRTDKSRTLKELGKSETPEEAHRLLLASGAWTIWENPHPERFALDRSSARNIPPEPPEEERLDLTGLAAYAIDSPWSDDPDDAVSLEGPDNEGRYCLWVHVADPAASVSPGSPVDMEARDRGATLYLPEGASRMLSPQAMSLFILDGVSPALSFKITLLPDLSIGGVEIHPSLIKASRLSYEEADALIAGGRNAVLACLAGLAERNVERRLDTGAVMIELPDAHIHVAGNTVTVEPVKAYRSAGMVRECMIWAGEGAARWALNKQLPFPFISQEEGELPEKRLPGLAGAWQLRRCMRPRNLSAKPGVHWGLGLDEYTQVTSPLRRYTDLVCHQQIRAFLAGRKILDEEEILFRVSAAEAAALTVNRAERASRGHWLAVYLSGKKDLVWEATVLDRKGNRGTVVIPALGLETQVSLRGGEEVNDTVSLTLMSVRIPEGEAVFVPWPQDFRMNVSVGVAVP
jgi:exoribonuclease-2